MSQPRIDFLEELDVLGRDLPEWHTQACHICARSTEAGYQPLFHGIGDIQHHDWRALRGLVRGSSGLTADCDDDIDFPLHELLCRVREAGVANADVRHVDGGVPIQDVSGLLKSCQKTLVPDADRVGEVRAITRA